MVPAVITACNFVDISASFFGNEARPRENGMRSERGGRGEGMEIEDHARWTVRKLKYTNARATGERNFDDYRTVLFSAVLSVRRRRNVAADILCGGKKRPLSVR